MYIRILKLEETKEDIASLCGARQTGKITLLKTNDVEIFPVTEFISELWERSIF